jgi:uncharacterized membrane protein affecting hemolysin expression
MQPKEQVMGLIDTEMQWKKLQHMSDEYLKKHQQVIDKEAARLNWSIFVILIIAILLMLNTYHNLYRSFGPVTQYAKMIQETLINIP